MAEPPHHEGEVHPVNGSRTIILATVAMLSLLLVACSSGTTAPAVHPPSVQPTATSIPGASARVTPIPPSAPEPDVPFGEPFSIRIGESLSVGSNELRAAFIEISEDSRCPSDVVCIWAGQVVVLVALEVGGDDLYSDNLIVGNAEESAKKIGDYMVEAIVVDPYPVSTGTIAQSDYILTLKVSLT